MVYGSQKADSFYRSCTANVIKKAEEAAIKTAASALMDMHKADSRSTRNALPLQTSRPLKRPASSSPTGSEPSTERHPTKRSRASSSRMSEGTQTDPNSEASTPSPSNDSSGEESDTCSSTDLSNSTTQRSSSPTFGIHRMGGPGEENLAAYFYPGPAELKQRDGERPEAARKSPECFVNPAALQK